MAEAFLAAVRDGDVVLVEELLAADPALAEARDEKGVSALMLAYYWGHPDAAEPILRRLRGLDVFEAAGVGDVERLAELLDGAPEVARAWSSDRATALHFAAFFGQPRTVRVLLERGAEVDAVSPTFGDVTPLHSAAAAPSAEIVQLLLAAGADPNARQAGGFTPLHSAALNGDAEMARALLEHGADPQAATDEGRRPAELAQEQGHAEVVALLEGRG